MHNFGFVAEPPPIFGRSSQPGGTKMPLNRLDNNILF
jgi:hypothetical protein